MSSQIDLSLVDQYSSDEWPRILKHNWLSADSAEIHLLIDARVRWFNGHFPGNPVLPGIAQTHWASEFGVALFRPEGDSLSLENLKFSEIVLPDTRCVLHIGFDRDLNRLNFKYSHEDRVYSQGRISFK